MLKKITIILGIIGEIAICILSFTVPKDPYEIVPAASIMGFDKPLWFANIFLFSFLYLFVLYFIYDKLEQRKIA